MTPERCLELAKECLEHSENCYQAGAYYSAVEWCQRAEEYLSKLQVVTTH